MVTENVGVATKKPGLDTNRWCKTTWVATHLILFKSLIYWKCKASNDQHDTHKLLMTPPDPPWGRHFAVTDDFAQAKHIGSSKPAYIR